MGGRQTPISYHTHSMSRYGPMRLLAASALAIAAAGCAGAVTPVHSPGYAAMFGRFAEIGADWNPPRPAEIVRVSFDLPVDAYVYCACSGEVTFVHEGAGCPGLAQFWIAVDEKGRRADWDTHRFHEGSFSVSSMYKLKAGHHTAYLMGRPHGDAYNFGYMSAHIIAIATQEGTIGANSWFNRE